MTVYRTPGYLIDLVRELCRQPSESEWIEFKENRAEAEEIGEYLSALSNAATLNGKAFGYVVWGVKDGTHAIVGTRFAPSTAKVGNEPLETWLLRLMDPRILFRFFELKLDDKPVVVLEIGRGFHHPVRFKKEAFIRVGSVKKALRDVPERERELWRILDQVPFEDLVAFQHVTEEEVVELLDHQTYFDLLVTPLPLDRAGILIALAADGLVRRSEGGGWDITNLGGLLIAKNLDAFSGLRRKAVRVVQYRGGSRVETLKEQVGHRGYASGFEGLVGYVNALLPSNEVIRQALREVVPMYPQLAVRELVANALIHQDFSMTGAGPMVEIFDDRIEITNPGEPLVDVRRFVDSPPRSRNEALASLMRRFRICEERGSGIDKVVSQIELFQLPAPLFERAEGFTRAVLFAHKPFSAMDREERARACYLHACLRYVMRQPATNASVRQRFGIQERNAATASRLLNEAVEDGLIVVRDPRVGTRIRSYLPFWAGPGAAGGAGGVA